MEETTVAPNWLVYHPDLILQDQVASSSEGGRIGLIIDQLMADGLWDEMLLEPDIAPLKRLRDIHEEDYLNELHKRCTYGAGQLDEQTPIMEKSFDLARLGAGGVLDSIDLMMAGEATTALVLTAMPGHFAGPANFRGGSLVNYNAIGAHYLTKKYQLKRVAILDLDAAHGRGTQEIFAKRRDILTLSMHEYPAFPGSGHYSEVGEKPAQGFNINIPMPSGYGDREWLNAFREFIAPILKQYAPEFLILSWGTNPLRGDASYHLTMSEFGLVAMLQEVMTAARLYCKNRLLSIFEGGTPGKLMARAFAQHAMLLLKNRQPAVDKGEKLELISYTDWYSYSKLLKNQFRKFWKL